MSALSKESAKGKRVLTRILNEPQENIMRLIREIQELTGRKLILYVANFNHPLGGIHLTDVLPFEEILRTTESSSVDFLLNSPGGEINATEKLVTMLRKRFDNIRLIVPNNAKSAATMMALASDQVVMGYLSELGPIDSQIPVPNPDGTVRLLPAQSVIDGITLLGERIAEAKKNGTPLDHFVVMAYRIDPNLWDLAIKAQKLSSQFAQKWLAKSMCGGDKKLAKEITSKFMDVEKFLSHGRMISAGDAKQFLPKGAVLELGRDDPLWSKIWELYVRLEWRLNSERVLKVFGNETGTFTIGAVTPQPTPRLARQIPPKQPPPKQGGVTKLVSVSNVGMHA